MATVKGTPPADAGKIFSDAFGGANLVTSTAAALQAFGNIWQIKQAAEKYLSDVHKNYWYHIAQLQIEYTQGDIQKGGVKSGVEIWNAALNAAIIGYDDITGATGRAAILEAKNAVVAILGAALNAAIKGFL